MTDRKWLTRILLAVILTGLGVLIYTSVQIDRLARIGAGYKAKIACSEIFLAGRDADAVLQNEFAGMDPVIEQIRLRIDEDAKTARAAGPFGLGQARALYREGYGCTLINGGRVSALPDPAPAPEKTVPWTLAPQGSPEAVARVDYAALDGALAAAFETNDIGNRAVLAAVDGKIVGERYAEGFTAETPFLSWSMGKSVTATLIGAAVLRGHVDVAERAPAALWENDPVRSQITWRDLLHMQSGLEFEEEYGDPGSAVNRMLFAAADAGGAAMRMPAIGAPGETWYYSSGTTNIIARLLRETLQRSDIDDQRFAREALFGPIGAASFTLEPDASGVFIGSSFAYASARDWARLGRLYLQDGVWEGERLLPEGWSAYVAAPASQSDSQYGAQFWLNRDGAGERKRFFKALPEDVYMMWGHEGQLVFMIPSKNAVVVRTGMTRGRDVTEAIDPLITAIFNAIGDAPAPASIAASAPRRTP